MPTASRSVHAAGGARRAATPFDEREEERRLNMRTLTIASAASATAAAVTSQLWIAGTWLAAAFTPVLVALVSEALHRPTERIARAWTSEREPRSPRAATPTRAEPASVTGTAGPVRVYRQTSRGATQANGSAKTSLSRSTALSRRRIAIGTVAVTAAIAFVIGIVTLTTADLVSGGSVGRGSGRTTLLGGRGDGSDATKDQQKQDSTQQQQQQQQQQQSPDRQQTTTPDEPTTTQPAPQPQSDTAPVPPPAETPPGEPAPQPIP